MNEGDVPTSVTRKRGVSSALRRCMSNAAVVAAAAADLEEDLSDRRRRSTTHVSGDTRKQ